MELKCDVSVESYRRPKSFNRTFMELKCRWVLRKQMFNCFNHTFMELKLCSRSYPAPG